MNRPKMPKKVKVGYSVFKIKHVRKKVNIDLGLKKGKKMDMGETEYAAQTIRIFGKQGPDELTNTIFHELLHAINDVHKIEYKSARQEENYVQKNADAIMTLFKDNPELLKYMYYQITKETLDN